MKLFTNNFPNQLTWTYKDIEIKGISLAGIYSSYFFPRWNLTFDVAQGPNWIIGCQNFFITHGHMDHAAGIPYLVSQKNMHKHSPPKFYMPGDLIKPMDQILKTWSQIEKFDYQYELLNAEEITEIEINKNLFVRPFKTIHRVNSLGYSIIEKKKRLKPEYLKLSKSELIELKNKNCPLEDQSELIKISISGDTEIEFLDKNPEILKSEVLFLESTFMDAQKSISDTKKWGHTHLSEIIERLPSIESKKILIKHISSRYSINRALTILDDLVPKNHRDRFDIFPSR